MLNPIIALTLRRMLHSGVHEQIHKITR